MLNITLSIGKPLGVRCDGHRVSCEDYVLNITLSIGKPLGVRCD